MFDVQINVQNMIDNQGIPVAIAGMSIVFSALIMISIFIGVLPKALPLLNRILPEMAGHHVAPTPTTSDAAGMAPSLTSQSADEELRMAAAAAFAWHARAQQNAAAGS